MRRYCISFYIFWITILNACAVRKDICEQCMKIEECPSFAHLNKHEQQVWLEQVPCEGQPPIEETTVLGFSPVAKGDYVCCPKSNIWAKENDNEEQISVTENSNTGNKPVEIIPNNNDSQQDKQQLEKNQNIVYPGQNYNGIQAASPSMYYNPNYQNIYGNQQNRPMGQNFYGNGPNNQIYGQNPYNPQYHNGRYPNNAWNNLGQPGVSPTNPGQPQNMWQYPNNRNPNYNNVNNGYGYSKPNRGDQCATNAATSLLPDPQTRCCGRDMSDALRITDLQSLLNTNAPSNGHSWPSNQQHQQPFYPSWPLYQQKEDLLEKEKISGDNNTIINVELDDRIVGGKETELDQFPWTVLLKMTFTKDNTISLFNCGGSLISRQYVLTAGHCVFEPGATLIGVNVTLAEYDKTTFPRDCKYEIGKKPKCIDNVMMFAEEVILHQQYDDDQLHNDIALIRLRGYAPYTRYIRPICLPPIDVDNNDLINLPLAVAGWGRNGQYVSDIKQSTIVHLVPHEECKKSYPYLSTSHVCAAGRTGQDTCKGDSGGPLMMMFRASYYVIGVVSGKRADSPCGTTVPSLYTNVFHYVPWIKQNMRN